MIKKDRFGLLKTRTDAHTMGLFSAAALLKDCGYEVYLATKKEEAAVEEIQNESAVKMIVEWIENNQINHLGFSYRLDPDHAVMTFGKLLYLLKKNRYFGCENAKLKSIHFAGLKEACDKIDKEYQGRIQTLRGGETPEETLFIMGVPSDEIPQDILEGCKYDKELQEYGKHVIRTESYLKESPLNKVTYKEFGTKQDTLLKRLNRNFKIQKEPLIRAHFGPYERDLDRNQCVSKYIRECRKLAEDGYLDILSIGLSQLSQSNFGENWGNKMNGGGVPVNSEEEYIKIWSASRPMLVRTYSATKNIKERAQMYEKVINIAWHALSLWWFNELDGRGPNSLYKNLQEHIDTLRYVAITGKPIEMNVSHHFAFRGCDDVTYIVSGYISAKMAKVTGNRVYILQNMLNTPRSTWGVQDIAKSRALLKLVKSLECNSFKVILQTRAGLDYFKPDLEAAKIQLAAVTAMMDDIDPYNLYSPEIIHVVNYSEALFLATPEIINDSIKITRTSLRTYRKHKAELGILKGAEQEIGKRECYLEETARKIIAEMEKSINDLYTPQGLYIAFAAGWLPVPELWSNSEEFKLAKDWSTRTINGGKYLMDNEEIMSVDRKINRCVSNIAEATQILHEKYLIRN